MKKEYEKKQEEIRIDGDRIMKWRAQMTFGRGMKKGEQMQKNEEKMETHSPKFSIKDHQFWLLFCSSLL